MNEHENRIDELIRNTKRQSILFLLIMIVAILTSMFFFYRYTQSNEALEEERRLQRNTLTQLTEVLNQRDSLIQIIGEMEASPVSSDSIRKAIKSIKDQVNVNKRRSRENVNYIVYLHDTKATQRLQSRRLQNNLEKEGFQVAGIERIDKDFTNSVKYFHKEDLEVATKIFKITTEFYKRNQFDPNQVNLFYIDHLDAPRGQVEVWYNPKNRFKKMFSE